jgi:sugar phosphate isomerase/epimerase
VSTVYVSTSCFRTRDLGDILAECAAYGVDALELGAIEGWDPSILESASYPSSYLVHNYFPPPPEPFVLNLASQDGALLERSRAHCRAALDLSERLGSPVYAAHAGYTADPPPQALGNPALLAELSPQHFAPRQAAYQTFVESVRLLSEYAAHVGVRFLVENHVLAPLENEAGARLLLMVEADELERLVEDVAHPAFGLLVDVGHLNVSATTLGFDRQRFLDRVAPYVAALHLSDNEGTSDAHRAFGDDAWFLPRLADFPAATLTLELAPLDPDRLLAARDTVARWR